MPDRLHHVDALRGVAALVVAFIFHQHYLTGQFHSGPLDGLPIFSWLHENGWVMVDLFFVISGLIFANVYLKNGRIHNGANSFAWARFARLYPLHLLTLIAAAAIFAINTPASVTYADNTAWNFGLNLLLLQESGLQSGKSFNLPSWSISVEIFCYFAFYILATRIKRGFSWVCFFVCVVALAATTAHNSSVDHVARGFCGFFAGVFVERGGLRSALILALVALFLSIICEAVNINLNLGALFGTAVFPTIVLVARYIPQLTHASFLWLGDRSYSIYLTHAPIYMALNVLIFKGEAISDVMVWPSIIVGWIVILAVADFSYRRFELPLRRWIGTASSEGRGRVSQECTVVATR